MSYLEIYNEDINDLLAPEHRKLQIHENLEVQHICLLRILFLLASLMRFFNLKCCRKESLWLDYEKKLLLPLNKFLKWWSLENVLSLLFSSRNLFSILLFPSRAFVCVYNLCACVSSVSVLVFDNTDLVNGYSFLSGINFSSSAYWGDKYECSQ